MLARASLRGVDASRKAGTASLNATLAPGGTARAERCRRLVWRGGGLDLDEPRVMGVLNVTPDSFSDGGRFCDVDAALARAHAMAEAGAAIIDVGGESTRPGALAVPEEEELRRVMPVIQRLVRELPLPVSVDTSKAQVIAAATDAGAVIVNDVRALRLAGALEAASAARCAVCLVHMQGQPPTMQEHPHYGDVTAEVRGFLLRRTAACAEAGIAPDHILIDPGFGFGKALGHNLELLGHLPTLLELDYPVVVGLSRKTSIGKITRREPADRLAGSLAAAVLAAWLGASVVRAHDVRETVDALAVVAELKRAVL